MEEIREKKGRRDGKEGRGRGLRKQDEEGGIGKEG